MPRCYTFRKAEHLRSPSDFRRVYDRRVSAGDGCLIVYGCENGLKHCRLGMSVGRKVGGAVQRNRCRRLLREAFRLTKLELPTGLDLVLVPRSATVAGLDELKESLTRLAGTVGRKLMRKEGST